MKREVRISYEDFCRAAIERITEIHSDMLGAKVEYIKKYNFEQEGRYDVFYDVPDEVSFTI